MRRQRKPLKRVKANSTSFVRRTTTHAVGLLLSTSPDGRIQKTETSTAHKNHGRSHFHGIPVVTQQQSNDSILLQPSYVTRESCNSMEIPLQLHFLECSYLKERGEEGEGEEEWCRRSLEKVLEKKERGIKVDEVEIMPACAAGENFAGEVYRVVVYGRRLCLGVWTDIRKNLIVKRVPESSSPCHRLYNCLRMFQNEVVAYERILPAFQMLLDNHSRNESDGLSFPRYLGRYDRLLVLQDLQTEGYQQVSRLRGFNLKECSLVLRELSRFHALSFAMKNHQEISFIKVVEELKETVFREEHIHDLTGVFWENSLWFAIKSLEESGDPRLLRVSRYLGYHSGKVLGTLIDLIKPDSERFDVLCHGDLWSNNILVRYCDSGYPVAVKFIDLQALRYSSCVLDVMHLLFTSSRPLIYDNHLDLLLKDYHTALHNSLNDLATPLRFTFDDLRQELKRKLPFGLFLACIMLTCVTRTGSPEPVNLNLETLSSEPELEKMYRGLNRRYHERLHALCRAVTELELV